MPLHPNANRSCVWNPDRIIVLRRVHVVAEDKKAAAMKAIAAQASSMQATATMGGEGSHSHADAADPPPADPPPHGQHISTEMKSASS